MWSDVNRGLTIVVKREGGKLWVWVNGFPISFKELFEIIRGLIACEREKYGDRLPWDPGNKVLRFVARCCKDEITWPELEREFQLTAEDRQRAKARDA